MARQSTPHHVEPDAVRKHRFPLHGMGFLLVGGVLGFVVALTVFFRQTHEPVTPDAPPARTLRDEGRPVRGSKGRLTHPLLTCSAEQADSADLEPLRKRITELADAARVHGLTRYAVHVSDLETCHWFEIGASETMRPASMLKLPIALAWMRRAQRDPGVLQQQYPFDVPANTFMDEDPNAVEALHSGQSYTVEDLLRRMLVFSRNDARYVLAHNSPRDALLQTWTDLGLLPPGMNGDPETGVHPLAMMLHALYDGAWMGPELSERMLSWLTEATYRDGLVGKLPQSAVVAHKFGRRLNDHPGPGDWTVQLHECGILYRPGRPLLVCALTEGHDEAGQAGFLQDLGVYLWTVPEAP